MKYSYADYVKAYAKMSKDSEDILRERPGAHIPQIEFLEERAWLLHMASQYPDEDYHDEWFRKFKMFEMLGSGGGNAKHKPVPPGPPDPTDRELLNLEKSHSAWELTITTDIDEPHIILAEFNKFVSIKMFDIVRYYGQFELTQIGLPHIHAVIFSKKKTLDVTKVKRYFKKRISFSRVRDLQKWLEYIKKSSEDILIKDYCVDHNIDQIIDGPKKN